MVICIIRVIRIYTQTTTIEVARDSTAIEINMRFLTLRCSFYTATVQIRVHLTLCTATINIASDVRIAFVSISGFFINGRCRHLTNVYNDITRHMGRLTITATKDISCNISSQRKIQCTNIQRGIAIHISLTTATIDTSSNRSRRVRFRIEIVIATYYDDTIVCIGIR